MRVMSVPKPAPAVDPYSALVVRVTANRFGVTPEAIWGRGGTNQVTAARYVACAILTRQSMSQRRLAEMFGYADRTVLRYGVGRVRREPVLRQQAEVVHEVVNELLRGLMAS